MSNQDENGWHIDKRINVGGLVMLATAIVAGFVWTIKLDGRIDVNDARIINNEKQIMQMREDNNQRYQEILRRLEGISTQLDRKQNSP